MALIKKILDSVSVSTLETNMRWGVHKAAYQNLTLHYLHASKVKALLIKYTTVLHGEKMNQKVKEKEKRKRNFDFHRRLVNCGISASQKT